MASPHKYPGSTGTTAQRIHGLFKDGIWCCNCPQRPAAAHRQTKKQGVNLGKWFWTCAQPPHLRCGFFLWANDATIREQEAILANSRSEPDPISLTPSRQNTGRMNNGLLTPQTERRYNPPQRNFKSPPKTAKARMISEASDDFGWNDDSDDNDELIKALSSSQTESFISQPNFHPKSPFKTPRTSTVTSPSKRKLAEVTNDNPSTDRSAPATPFSSRSSRTEMFPPSSAELCMTPTPSKYNDVLSADSKFDTSDLAKSLLGILEKHSVVLPNKAHDEVVSLLNRQDLKTQGIIRGRDMTRVALKKKDDDIKKLQDRVSNLEAQRELDRSLIEGMKPY
ncbi:Zinc finger GRF-type [Penicillium cf. griseofulvum]|uniref:Zinc finger GRF-type n=1 Tax=Penicillium cf. griseofulvum TaxID=2972120 RepID=A0A9W9T6L6_9EURO|nr:Zinc finger GRF-type [Penicillium cf. griseofulvum]KAJ5421847.1 Zinc finger GRF-type [Penicillium cf. griseofulvum]KAJ5428037.1 Zinc finger GRF-type [Penicillium cf. griseofulvum]